MLDHEHSKQLSRQFDKSKFGPTRTVLLADISPLSCRYLIKPTAPTQRSDFLVKRSPYMVTFMLTQSPHRIETPASSSVPSSLRDTR